MSEETKFCNKCKNNLTFDKFKQKNDGTYLVGCLNCNEKEKLRLQCEHGKRRSYCIQCNGGSMCEHGKRISRCTICGGTEICHHSKYRSQCKECDGGSFCEHDKQRSVCKLCNGGSICEHDRKRTRCKDCNGGSICEHKKQRAFCKDCNFGSYLKHIVTGACKHALKTNKSHSSIKYLGCDIETFKNHIEGQFHPGMSWDNYGEWEIDHIIPIKYKKPTIEQQISRLHFTNTQPLWKEENMKKM